MLSTDKISETIEIAKFKPEIKNLQNFYYNITQTSCDFSNEFFHQSSSVTMVDPKFPQIDKLDGLNYSSWMEQIEAILVEMDLWIDLDENNGVVSVDDTGKARKAYVQIVLRCDKPITVFIAGVAKNNSVKTLRALRKKYDSDSIMNIVYVLRGALLMRLN